MTRRRQLIGGIVAASVAGCGELLGDGTNDTGTQTGPADREDAGPAEEPAEPGQGVEVQRVVEDFESDTLSGYTGDESGFRLDTDRAANGSSSLVADNPGTQPYELIAPESIDPPVVGERFRYDLHLGSTDFGEGIGFNMYFGHQGPEQHHAVKVDRGEDKLELDDATGAKARADVRAPLKSWLTVEVDWTAEGQTTARLYHDDEVIAATSMVLSGPTDGTIGWRPTDARDADRWVDYLRVVA